MAPPRGAAGSGLMSAQGGMLIGVDLGTTGLKAALYSADGAPLVERTAPTPLRWHGTGRVDQDPDAFYGAATATIAECVRSAGAEPGAVEAVAICGQMAGTMGVDAAFEPTTPYDSWLDLRCAEEVDWLERELGDSLVETSGCPAMVNHAPKIVWWRRHEPAAFDRTVAWIPPGSYVAGRLAGLRGDEAFIDTTYLHFTGLADLRAGTWSDRLTEALEVPAERLPRIVEPTELIGRLTPEAAEACGLPAGTPLAAGLGDTAAGTLGAGVVRAGQLLDLAGTASVLAGSVAEFRPDVGARTLITMRGAVPGQWVSLAYLSGGSLLGWLAGLLLGDDYVERDAAGDAVASPEGLERLAADAASVPAGADGLLFLPYLDGRILPNEPAMRGAWLGLHRRHGRAHLSRAVLEGVAFAYRRYLELLTDLHPGLTFAGARVAGGGARSATWNQLKASALGVRYTRLQRSELSCWGAALVAGAAVGAFDDLAAAAEAAAPEAGAVEPVAEDHATYVRLHAVHRAFEDAVAEPSRELERLLRDLQEVLA
jgi:xylulokinase